MKTYLVGGAVRDLIMGITPKDHDYVVVGSTPEEMIAAGFKQVGADFPVFLNDEGTEFALARTERKSGVGYHGFVTDHSPEVTLEQDLERRDLTINAMALSEDFMTTIDPFGGLQDIENKVLRHVSPAFADDPVRVLRLARFHARFGPDWEIAPETIELCQNLVRSGELDHLTRERVLAEFEKALGERYPWMFYDTMNQLGAWEVLFPELDLIPYFSYLATPASVYSSTVAFLSDEEKEAFETRLNVRTHWRDYAKMYRAWLRCDVRLSKVDMLYRMGAFRNPTLFEEVMRDAEVIGRGLGDAYNKTKVIGFVHLSQEQQKNLKGSEIAAAIRQKRKEVYES